MAIYQCDNAECKHKWSSTGEPFKCPRCQRRTFHKVAADNTDKAQPETQLVNTEGLPKDVADKVAAINGEIALIDAQRRLEAAKQYMTLEQVNNLKDVVEAERTRLQDEYRQRNIDLLADYTQRNKEKSNPVLTALRLDVKNVLNEWAKAVKAGEMITPQEMKVKYFDSILNAIDGEITVYEINHTDDALDDTGEPPELIDNTVSEVS